jgi:hypothetical protein
MTESIWTNAPWAKSLLRWGKRSKESRKSVYGVPSRLSTKSFRTIAFLSFGVAET